MRSTKFTNLIIILLLGLSSSLLGEKAIAQSVTGSGDLVPSKSIPQAFHDAFFEDSGSIYENATLWYQVKFILGLTFPENEIGGDGRRINDLYLEVLKQQVSQDPLIRTRDLANPYNSSLLSEPRY